MDGTGETDACRPIQTAGSSMAEAETDACRPIQTAGSSMAEAESQTY